VRESARAALRAVLREGYQRADLKADLLAGVVVGIVALPWRWRWRSASASRRSTAFTRESSRARWWRRWAGAHAGDRADRRLHRDPGADLRQVWPAGLLISARMGGVILIGMGWRASDSTSSSSPTR